MTRIATRLSIACVAAAAAFHVSGCSIGQDTSESEISARYQLPDVVQYNYRWSAESGINLLGPDATVVRAYFESYYIASFAHSTAAGYPGFENATEDVAYDPPRHRAINDRTNYNPLPIVGTFHAHLLSIERNAFGMQAVVCEGDYSLMDLRRDGTYTNRGVRIPTAMQIEFTPGSAGITDTARYAEGPERTPQNDVFGGWTVTRHAFSTGNFDDNLACQHKFPDPPETRPERINETFTVPYPTLPPYPGWSSSQ
ncbi:hypothetical protein ACWDUD_27890 [Rhodococcus sp. NPDC003382]